MNELEEQYKTKVKKLEDVIIHLTLRNKELEKQVFSLEN